MGKDNNMTRTEITDEIIQQYLKEIMAKEKIINEIRNRSAHTIETELHYCYPSKISRRSPRSKYSTIKAPSSRKKKTSKSY